VGGDDVDGEAGLQAVNRHRLPVEEGAGVVDDGVQRLAEVDEVVGQLPYCGEISQLGDVGRHGAVWVGDVQFRHRLDGPLLVPADHEHLGAEVQQLTSGGPADARGRPGEQDALAGEGVGRRVLPVVEATAGLIAEAAERAGDRRLQDEVDGRRQGVAGHGLRPGEWGRGEGPTPHSYPAVGEVRPVAAGRCR
jgi:hypothetical protein